jgi:hypothetical protein
MTPPLRPVVPGIYFDQQDRVVWDYAAFVQHFGGSTGGGGDPGGGGGELPNPENLVSHWDAALGVSTDTGSVVTLWADQVGDNDLTPENSGRRPALVATGGPNDLPYISFLQSEGAAEFANLYKLSGATVPGATFTWFLVGRYTTGTEGLWLDFHQGVGFGLNGGKWAAYHSSITQSATAIDTNWHVFVGQRTGGSFSCRMDGADLGFAITTQSNFSGRIAMAQGLGGGQGSDHRCAEAGFYSTAEDVDAVGSALASKYGLTWTP